MISLELDLLVAQSHITLTEAMQKIDMNGNGVLFLVNDENKLCGAVSDGDIRRWILKTSNLVTEISKVMNQRPIFIFDFEREKASAYMEERSISVLPVTDEEKNIVDIVFAKKEKETAGSGAERRSGNHYGRRERNQVISIYKDFTEAINPYWRRPYYGKDYRRFL